jgi:hypothetical protein
MLVLGPTTAPRPAPNPPAIADLLEAPAALGPGEQIRYETGAPSFLVEVSARGGAGIVLWDGDREVLRLETPSGSFFRLLRLEVDGPRVAASLDEDAPFFQGILEGSVTGLSLTALKTPAEFSGFALTGGWEDLFEEESDPAAAGWETADGSWRIEGGRLRGEGESRIARGPALTSYLAVVNARLESGEGYGFAPALSGEAGPWILLERGPEGWSLRSGGRGAIEQIFPLPAAFDARVDQQLRFRKVGGVVEVAWEGLRLGEIPVPPGPARVGLTAGRGSASFEAVRVTAL